MQAQEISTGHGLCALCVVSHGGAAGVEFLQAGNVPFARAVGNLNADLGRVFDGCVKGVERQYILTTDDDCLVAGAQGDGVNCAAICHLLGCKSHIDVSPLFLLSLE